MEIYERLAENIIRDYFTPNIKAEVLLDTILTPVIGDILTVVGQKNKNLGINGEMKLLAKEFPMLKVPKEDEINYRNCNADYLMCDAESVYFVELKTTQESLDCDQMINYRKYLENCKDEDQKFFDVSGAEFIKLLNHVSQTGYSSDNKNKPWNEEESPEQDDLKRVFEAVIQYPKYTENKGYGKTKKIPLMENWANEEDHHVDDAIAYLRKNKAVSSKKYLFTAGQMLNHMKYGEWWNCNKIKLVYLVPETPSDKEIKEILEYYQKGFVIIVTFREMMEQAYLIGKESEKQKLKKYWNWVMEILIQCGLY